MTLLGQPAVLARDPRWLWRVEGIPGESLSSLLLRQALVCGVTPRELLTDLGYAHTSSPLDPDRDFPSGLMPHLASRMGVPTDSLQHRTLWALLETMGIDTHHMEDAPAGSRKQVLPWVLPSKFLAHQDGARGIPFCPICVTEQGSYWTPLVNRLAFTVVCRLHGCLLHERCPTCGDPTSPGGNPLEIMMLGFTPTLRCQSCTDSESNSHSAMGSCPVVRLAPQTLVNFHSTLMNGLTTGRILLSQVGPMSLSRFLAGLRRVHTVMFHLKYQGEDLGCGNLLPDLADHSLPIRGSRASTLEVLPLDGRLDAMVRIARFCEMPIDHWDSISQSRFDLGRTIRSWMHPWDGIDEAGHTLPNPVWTKHTILPPTSLDLQVIKRFFDLVDSLSIPEDLGMDLCGATTRREYRHWKRIPRLKVPVPWRRKASKFVRLWDTTVQFFESEIGAEGWLVMPNPRLSFENLSPLELFAFDSDDWNPSRLLTFLRDCHSDEAAS